MRKLSDPKLYVGALLIIASITAGWWIVDQHSGGEEFYVVRENIAPGTKLTPAQLDTMKANPALSKHYMKAQKLTKDWYVRRQISKGELLPNEALTSTDVSETRPLVVKVAEALPTNVRVGDEIELWFITEEAENEPAQVTSAILTGTKAAEDAFGQEGPRLELRVPTNNVAALLQTLGKKGKLVAVAKHR
ncbi:MAG: hypothetical protein Q4A71_07545 [Actinomycetaceae bacterium]|nr:hypothetical protein [Actinomycetaceae bacterium]